MILRKSQNNKPKLLFVVEAMAGGIFTYIVDLANDLVKNFDIYIAYGVRAQTPMNYISYFDKKIRLIKVKDFTRSINIVKDIEAFFEIKMLVKQIKPDIIHLHSSKAGVLGRWAINGHKIPMFYTPHGYSFLMADNSKFENIFYKLVEVISAKRYCTTISCSKGEHKETLKFTKNAIYINNGINMNNLQSLINSIEFSPKHPFTVFTLGRICYQKNPRLFNQLAKAMPDVRFLWIGDGELRNELKEHNIEITGWLEREKALEYSLQADVFVLTSLWEGLPISLLEAMYMKKLCIVNNTIGNRDVIHNNKNGFVCNTIEDFIKAIRIAQSEKAKILIKNAYTDVQMMYNTNVMTKKYSAIYKSRVLNNSSV